jgi:hypothetical protein
MLRRCLSKPPFAATANFGNGQPPEVRTLVDKVYMAKR